VFCHTFDVSSSQNNIELSQAATDSGCGETLGNHIVLLSLTYHNIHFIKLANADFQLPVFQVINIQGYIS
jgi:hypothetical protein